MRILRTLAGRGGGDRIHLVVFGQEIVKDTTIHEPQNTYTSIIRACTTSNNKKEHQ
jgi:hypothetical protein